MNKDWRLSDQMEYLNEKKLIRAVFKSNAKNDHEHCEFCWEKFSELEDDLHQGYCTIDRYYWICEECYNDFKEMFNWKLV